MEDLIQVEVTGDADAVTSELFVENTIGNLVWHTVEENHSSLVFENIDKVIKLESDIIEDNMWESTIEIMKNVDKQSIMELPLEYQDETNKCTFCGKRLKSKFGLNKHIQKHHNSMYRCTFCKLLIDCSKYIEHKKSHERRDQTKSDIATQNSMANNCHILNHKKETKSSSIKKTNFCAKIHTLKMYKCNDCGQQFETNLARDNHVWENHSDNISTSNKN